MIYAKSPLSITEQISLLKKLGLSFKK